MFYCFRQYNETFARKLKNDQCTMVRQQTGRYSFADSSALFKARNQEFFRGGEVSENKGTSINI